MVDDGAVEDFKVGILALGDEEEDVAFVNAVGVAGLIFAGWEFEFAVDSNDVGVEAPVWRGPGKRLPF